MIFHERLWLKSVKTRLLSCGENNDDPDEWRNRGCLNSKSYFRRSKIKVEYKFGIRMESRVRRWKRWHGRWSDAFSRSRDGSAWGPRIGILSAHVTMVYNYFLDTGRIRAGTSIYWMVCQNVARISGGGGSDSGIVVTGMSRQKKISLKDSGSTGKRTVNTWI